MVVTEFCDLTCNSDMTLLGVTHKKETLTFRISHITTSQPFMTEKLIITIFTKRGEDKDADVL